MEAENVSVLDDIDEAVAMDRVFIVHGQKHSVVVELAVIGGEDLQYLLEHLVASFFQLVELALNFLSRPLRLDLRNLKLVLDIVYFDFLILHLPISFLIFSLGVQHLVEVIILLFFFLQKFFGAQEQFLFQLFEQAFVLGQFLLVVFELQMHVVVLLDQLCVAFFYHLLDFQERFFDWVLARRVEKIVILADLVDELLELLHVILLFSIPDQALLLDAIQDRIVGFSMGRRNISAVEYITVMFVFFQPGYLTLKRRLEPFEGMSLLENDGCFGKVATKGGNL